MFNNVNNNKSIVKQSSRLSVCVFLYTVFMKLLSVWSIVSYLDYGYTTPEGIGLAIQLGTKLF